MQQDIVQIHLYTIGPDSNMDGQGQLSTSDLLKLDPKIYGFLCPLNFTQLGSLDSSLKHWEGVLQTIINSIEKIKLYAEIANEQWVRPSKENSVQTYIPRIFILLVSAKDFTTKQGSSNADKKLTKIISYFRHTCLAQEGEETLAEHAFDYQPIITVGVEDLMSLYSEEENPGDFRRDLNLDHRIKYLDSSIWNRYLPLHGDDPTLEPFAERFLEIIQQMVTWHREGLYQSVAAVTTLEFQTRMLYNSFIAKVGEKGHNELVRPFKFHSETQMRRKANEIMKFFEADRNGVTLKAMLKWNFLLVDDQAEKVPMTNIYNGHSSSVTKSRLIQEIFKDDFPSLSISMEVPKQEIGIVDEMIDQLKPNNPIVFDVILLDYLLGLGKEREREYGHDFLLRLRKEPTLQKGPYNRFWIFPISSFPHAFTDKLHQLGINHLTDWWHLSNGGDPVCAPELFRYNLLEFLRQQISVCYYDEMMMARMIQKFKGIHQYDDWIESTSRIVRHIQAFRDQLRRKKGSKFCSSFITFLDAQKHMLHLESEFLKFLELLGGWGSNETIKNGIKAFHKRQPTISKALPPLKKMLLTRDNKKFKIYILHSGAAEDIRYLNEIKTHIKSSLKRFDVDAKSIEDIRAGDTTSEMITEMITMANLFLILISADLLVFDQKDEELNRILSTNKRIIPIKCRNCFIDDRLAKFKALPDNGKFLSQSSNLDEEVSIIIDSIIKEIDLQKPRT